jgi:hypothetical protein
MDRYANATAAGRIVWYCQHVNEHWTLDHPFERLLVDTAVARAENRA